MTAARSLEAPETRAALYDAMMRVAEEWTDERVTERGEEAARRALTDAVLAVVLPRVTVGQRALNAVVRLHVEGVLSEGQCCRALGMERLDFRAVRDETAADLPDEEV